MTAFGLQPAAPAPDRARLAALACELALRDLELMELRRELQGLHVRYLGEIAPLYARLTELEGEVAAAEIRAGLRAPGDGPGGGETDADRADQAEAGCSNPATATDTLKRVFRDVAKAIHPDLADDEPARCRRHSLMAEANRAYAERDEDRLRLILRAFQGEDESWLPTDDDDPERVERRTAAVEIRLASVNDELAELRASAIGRLRLKIDDARQQGWDLFGEMRLQVRREIARATARLAVITLQAWQAENTLSHTRGPRG